MGSVKANLPYGYRLVPVLIDEIATESPEKVFASIPKSVRLQEGYTDVTYRDFSRAIDRAAAFLDDTFGKSGNFETLAYLGPVDLRYFILICAASKIGYKLLLPSPRNSLEGQLNLFKSTDCKALLTSTGYKVPMQLISDSNLTPISIPSLVTLLADGEATHYPFTKSYEEAKNDPFMVLHTSGSTGLPKPIVLKHGWASALDAYNLLEEIDGYSPMWWKFKNRRAFVGLPPFHANGIVAGLFSPLYFDAVTVWPPADRPLSTVLVDEVLDVSGTEFLYVPPSILEDLVQFPDSLRKVERLAVVGYGGAPLDIKVGNLLCKKTSLVNTTGSTEMGVLPYWDKAPEDWQYFYFNPLHKGIQFRPAEDGVYEQIFVRHPSTDKYHSGWWTFPDLNECTMNDLYTPHPSKPNLWLYAGRADDVIVLSNGEKLNPSTMESTLRQHPNVKGALVVGQSRFAPAAIVELQEEVAQKLDTPEKRAQFLEDEIWPFAVRANEVAPAHAQLSLDRIILSHAEKPFGRAGKMTMQRGVTTRSYSQEIDEIYSRGEEVQENLDLPKIDVHQDLGNLEADLGTLIEGMTKITNLEVEQDFFAMGMDSLHIMTLVRLLKNTLVGIPHENINGRLIYGNPSLTSLATALKKLVSGNNIANGVHVSSREEEMLKVLDQFTSQLSQQLVVILTGSTGSLGSYLLHTFLSSPKVSKVYCLNRAADAEEKQTKGNIEKGLCYTWDHRVEFLHADLSKPLLGLHESTYSRLKNEVSVIIHNQWPVDFNRSLTSFIPHIQGVSNLTSLSSHSQLKPPIFFTSSIGTLAHWPEIHPSQPLVSETALSDPRLPLCQGYSESKWIAENLLSVARVELGVSSAILRVGQIAGPVRNGRKGEWSKSEWLPSLVASCKYMGVVPDSLPSQEDARWIPVDVLAEIIGELVVGDCARLGKDEEGSWTRYYHLCNPHEGSWRELMGVVKNQFDRNGKEIEVVAFGEWVSRLEVSAEKQEDVARNPAVKLLDFYRGMRDGGKGVAMDTKETQRKSKVMGELGAVSGEWMRLWLEQWDF